MNSESCQPSPVASRSASYADGLGLGLGEGRYAGGMRASMHSIGAMRARWRGAALLPPAVLAVHQLRYALAYGTGYGSELTTRGDSYTEWLIPLGAVLLGLVLGALLGRAAEAWRTGVTGRSSRMTWRTTWCALTLTLVLCFCAQEWLELLLEPGHAGSFTGILGSGGWTALPAAAAVAALLVTLIRGAQIALSAIVRRSRARRGERARGRDGVRPSSPRRLSFAPATPLASCCAGRAPPPAATSA